MSRASYWMIVGSTLLVALISLRALVLPLDLVMPNMAHFQADLPWALWGHVLFGPLALVLAPVQLSATLRARRPRLHRISGRVYGAAVLIAGLSSLAFAPLSHASDFARTGFIIQSVVWLALTGTGIGYAMRGDLIRHRIWILRSIALTLTAVTLRVVMAVLVAAGWTPEQTYDVTAWGAWIFNLIVLEMAVRRRSPRFSR